MGGPQRSLAVTLALLVTAWSVGAATTKTRDWWQQQAEDILDREWDVVEHPTFLAGPPRISVVWEDVFNACTVVNGAAEPLQTEIRIFKGLLDTSVDDDVDSLAGIIGHELNHLLLGHHRHRPRDRRDRIIGLFASREDEIQCDILGMAVAERAGYDREGLIRAFLRSRERVGDHSFWGGLMADHPSFSERLAAMDKQHREFWHSLIDFEVGVDLLRTGNYRCAEACFRGALVGFPHAPEVLCNLAYSLLMQYYQKLPDSYWDRHPGGHPVPFGFATFLPVEPWRVKSDLRTLRPLWEEARQLLEIALALRPDNALALGNLGFAWLMAPDGPVPDQAKQYLERLDGSACPMDAQWARDNNLALSQRLLGDLTQASTLLDRCRLYVLRGTTSILFTECPVINQAALDAESTRRDRQERAAHELEAILPKLPPESSQWRYAYRVYVQLCEKIGRLPLDPLRLTPSAQRARSTFLARRDVAVFLGDHAMRVARVLGDPEVVVPMTFDTSPSATDPFAAPLCTWRYQAEGVELTFFHQRLIRAKLHPRPGRNDWEVVVISGDGVELDRLQVGDPVTVVEHLFPDFDGALTLGGSETYRVYSGLRLAMLVDDGIVRSLALVGGTL